MNTEAETPPPGVAVMRVVRWGLVLLVALVAAWALWQARYEKNSEPQTWTCPMHPSVVQEHPGECPLCGMDLVLATETESEMPSHGPAGTSVVTLAVEEVERLGLKTVEVRTQTMAASLRVLGVVAAEEKGLAEIHTRFAGWVEKLHVTETGQRVEKGQVLAEVYSPELLAAQAEYLAAQGWDAVGASRSIHGAGSLGADARRRLELLGISPEEIATLEARKEPLRALPLRSPARGHVTVRRVVQGAYVQPGALLFEVADLSRVWVLAELPEIEAGKVAKGQRASVGLTAYPEQTFVGVVDFLYPSVDAATRTRKVRVVLPNPKLLLLPGMYAELALSAAPRSMLVIPRDALIETGSARYVFLADDDRYEPRSVEVGQRIDDWIEIRSGLKPKDQVVTSANFLLDSESRIRAARRR